MLRRGCSLCAEPEPCQEREAEVCERRVAWEDLDKRHECLWNSLRYLFVEYDQEDGSRSAVEQAHDQGVPREALQILVKCLWESGNPWNEGEAKARGN